MQKADQIAVLVQVPAVEPDPQLEGGVAAAHELGLRDAEMFHGGLERWDGGFADADDADLRRLDDRDRDIAVGRRPPLQPLI